MNGGRFHLLASCTTTQSQNQMHRIQWNMNYDTNGQNKAVKTDICSLCILNAIMFCTIWCNDMKRIINELGAWFWDQFDICTSETGTVGMSGPQCDVGRKLEFNNMITKQPDNVCWVLYASCSETIAYTVRHLSFKKSREEEMEKKSKGKRNGVSCKHRNPTRPAFNKNK